MLNTVLTCKKAHNISDVICITRVAMVPGITFSAIISFVMREFIDPDEREREREKNPFLSNLSNDLTVSNE